MVVTRKASNPAPVPSRTNTAPNRPAQLRDPSQSARGLDLLDPYATHDGPIPPQFADNVQYIKPTKSTQAGSASQMQASLLSGSSKTKQKAKKKSTQKTAIPQLVSGKPRRTRVQSLRWPPFEAWVLVFFFAYVVTICPTDTRHEHAVCAAVDEYQSYIPYSYIRYQFDAALQHPYVAPVVQQASPYYKSAVTTTTPYVVSAQQQWKRRVAPVISHALLRAELWATPYAIAFAEGFHQRVDPYIYRLQRVLAPYRGHAQKYMLITLRRMYLGWRAAQPRISTAWVVLKTVPGRVLAPFADAWQTWGDPHVRRMWVRMQEVVAADNHKRSKAQRRKPQATFGAFAQRVGDDGGDPEEDNDVEPVESAASSSKAPSAASEAEDDVAAFLSELLADDEEPKPSEESHVDEQPIVQAEDEKEAVRRRHLQNIEKAKDKRAQFEKDFQSWLDKLDATVHEQTEVFVKELEEERKAVLAAFQSKDSRVAQDIDTLENELTLFLKSMSTYLESLHKDIEAKQRPQLWQKLIDRLQEKVDARVHQTEQVVQELWEGVQKLEEGIIERVHKPIYLVSEEAQAKLGLPLAWLEDVTPADWRRFHDMKQHVKGVRKTFVEIQEGDHPRSPVDPIVVFFKRAQADVQDILAGFEVQFNEVRRKGEASFRQPKTEPPPEETAVYGIGGGRDEIKVALPHDEL